MKNWLNKYAGGGDISIADLDQGNWLNKFPDGGFTFPSYQMPRQGSDSNAGLNRNREKSIKIATQTNNQNDAIVNNFKKANPWAANLSYNDVLARASMKSNSLAAQNQMSVKKAGPAQSTASKAWEVASHPMTALKYTVHNQRIPDNFSRGENNPLDYAVSAFNPATYINAAVGVGKEIIPSLNPISTKPGILNTLGKASINAVTNLVDGTNVYNDGTNERALDFVGNALTVLPMAAELKPMLGKTLGNINNAIQTKPFLNRAIYGAPEEEGMITARASAVPELNWNRQARAAELAKPKPNTSLFGETFDNPKLSQREFIKTVEGPSGMKHDVGYQNYPPQQGYDFQRTFGMQGKDPSQGYLKFDLWKDKNSEYPELGDFSFFNSNKVSASDHIKMMMGNLPKKVYMPPAGDEKLFSMYSQPIVNANVSRLAGNPRRITIKPTGKNSVLNTGYLENTDQNFLQQAAEQFPRIQKSYKTLSDYTGVQLPEPKMYVDNKLATAEDLLSPELQKRMADSKFNYVRPDVFRIEVPDYDVHKHFKQGGWLNNYANGGGFLMPFAKGGMVDPILKYPDGGPYTVKSGDTLWRIARQYGMTPQQLAEANGLQNIDKIKVNQVLNIPTLNPQPAVQQPTEQPVVDASFVGPQMPVVMPTQQRESVIQTPTNVRRVQAPVTQEKVVNTRQETPQVLNVQQPKAQSIAPASNVLGEAPPLFKTTEERDAWRQRLKSIAKNALNEGGDQKYLAELHGITDANGNPMTWANGENCINGICGLNKAAGLNYNAGTYQGRYIGNVTFYDNVNNKKEDYYRVNGNFQIGDHIQLQHPKVDSNGNIVLDKNGKPVLVTFHSMEIYDNDDMTEDGQRMHRVIHNGGGTDFKENLYTDQELRDMIADGRAIINRPGYSLDKELLKKEREAATSPEARAALEKKKQLVDYQTEHDPNYQYSIKEDSEYYKNQPEGMKKFVEFANDPAKVNKLVEKLGVSKDVIHDELLNTFGELGQENKWENPTFGGSLGLENTWEKIATGFGGGKNLSVGPGQIKFKTLDPELKKKFNINSPKDLYDWDKVIPLMTAINIRNRQWMERKGTDLSKFLIAQPGAAAEDLKYGVGRWTPYMYRGSLRIPTTNEEAKTLEEGSYADKVYHNIENNLQRILPYKLDDGTYREMQPVVITGHSKKWHQEHDKKALGGQNNNWLNNYL